MEQTTSGENRRSLFEREEIVAFVAVANRSWLLALLSLVNVVLLLAAMRMINTQMKFAAGMQQKLQELRSRFDGRFGHGRRGH